MNKALIRGLATGISITVGTWVVTTGVVAHQTYRALQQRDLSSFDQHIQRLDTLVKPLHLLTVQQLATLQLVETGANCSQTITQTQQDLTTYSQILLDSNQTSTEVIQQLPLDYHQVQTCVNQLADECNRSHLVKQFAGQTCQQLFSYQQLLTDLEPQVDYWLNQDHTILVVLQNNQELRATGGFMGSYAKIKLNQGKITDLTISDIYEPDGQFPGFVTPPPGVAEYLSEGHGLRLPDSNWNPDFPMAAQQILHFFAQGKEQSIDNLIAINLSVIKRIMMVTGEIPLPDYGVAVTSDNVDQIARADRDEFFPGSQQKTNFLNALFTQLKFKLTQLTSQQQQELATILLESVRSKDLLAFSNDETLQNLYLKYQLAGALPNQPLLYLVESNVGINKANKDVYREVKLTVSDYRTTLAINFTNNNPLTAENEDSLHYINYQRLLVDPQFTIHQISVNGTVIDHWDSDQVVTAEGQKLTQIGFLVTVPEQQSTSVEIELTTDQPVTPFTILKQPGLPPTPYTVETATYTNSFLLEKDTDLTFSEK